MPDHRNPFEGVTDFFSELARMRSIGVRGGAEHGLEHVERTHASAWVPTTDILALGDDLVIRLELAGVDPDDVDLRFTHGVLTVSGTRASGESDDDAEFYIRERFYGEFRRTITLPEGTDAEDINAEFEDGLVEITVRGGVSPGRQHADRHCRQVRRSHVTQGPGVGIMIPGPASDPRTRLSGS